MLGKLGFWKKYGGLVSLSSPCTIYWDPHHSKVAYLFVNVSSCRGNFNRFLNSTVPGLQNTVHTSRCDFCAVPSNTVFLLSESQQQDVLPVLHSTVLLPSSEIPFYVMQAIESSLSAVLIRSSRALCSTTLALKAVKNFCAEIFHVSHEP